ncbi:MAG: hypothetical protein H3C47_00475 [Candidatus Cloacimonetes bacterium]|nr:hypothetical protein [Candidatus Cloacimonadota bacterium]
MKWLLILAFVTVGSLYLFSSGPLVTQYTVGQNGPVDTSRAEFLGGGLIVRQPLMAKEWVSYTIMNVLWRWLVFSRRQDSGVQAAYFASDMGIFKPFDGFSLRVLPNNWSSWELVQDRSLWSDWIARLSREQTIQLDLGEHLCLRQGLDADFCLSADREVLRISNRIPKSLSTPNRECVILGSASDLTLDCSQKNTDSIKEVEPKNSYCSDCSSYVFINWKHLPESLDLKNRELAKALSKLVKLSGIVYKRQSAGFSLNLSLTFNEPSDSARILTELIGYLIENQHPYKRINQGLHIPLPFNFGHLSIKRERSEIRMEFGDPVDISHSEPEIDSSIIVWDLQEMLPLLRTRIEGSLRSFIISMQETCQKNREEHNRFCPMGPALTAQGCLLHNQDFHLGIGQLLYGDVLKVLPVLTRGDFELLGDVEDFRARVRWR